MRSVATDCIVVCIAAVVLFAAAFIPWITSPALTYWVALPRPGRLGRRSLTVTRSSSTKVEEGQKTSGTEDYDLGELAVEASHYFTFQIT